MKALKPFLFIVAIIFSCGSFAQDVTTVEAKTEDISENLDLEAVASVFGESKDLEDFEKRLNDPEAQITNLDMNGDSIVDYLRVMETVKDDTHYIAIQAVLGEDQYQDVASIEVEKDSKGETTVQVVGDVYMYGPDYIIQPVYVRPPVIYTVFWVSMYRPYHSPWYWHHHPPYYRPWHPYPHHHYHSHVRVHINPRHSYHRTTVRYSRNSVAIQKRVRRNDYGARHKNSSYANRRANARPATTNRVGNTRQRDVNKKVSKDWKPKTGNTNSRVRTKQRSNISTGGNKARVAPQRTNSIKRTTPRPVRTRPVTRTAPPRRVRR